MIEFLIITVFIIATVLMFITFFRKHNNVENFATGALTQLNSTSVSESIKYPEGRYIGKYPYYHFIFNGYPYSHTAFHENLVYA